MGVLGELNHTPLKSGKSKSKTPLKSPRPAPVGVLSPNNDALEKRRSKLARQASETSRRWVYCTPPLTSPHGARKLFQHHKKFSVVTPDSGDARLLLHVTAARARGGFPILHLMPCVCTVYHGGARERMRASSTSDISSRHFFFFSVFFPCPFIRTVWNLSSFPLTPCAPASHTSRYSRPTSRLSPART